jgi:hypothetical protein
VGVVFCFFLLGIAVVELEDGGFVDCGGQSLLSLVFIM